AVRRALDQRTDLDIARKTVQENDVTLRFLRDQEKPQVDLALSYQPQGIGGTQLVRSQPGVLGSPFTTIPGGITDAFTTLFHNQQDLATAQNNELQAILNYRKSLVELERLQQTTLSSQGITVLSGSGGATTTRTGS